MGGDGAIRFAVVCKFHCLVCENCGAGIMAAEYRARLLIECAYSIVLCW